MTDAYQGLVEIVLDVLLDLGLGLGIHAAHVDAGEVRPAQVLVVVLQVTQEIDLLERGSQLHGGRLQSLVQRLIALAEHPQAHQAHDLGTAQDVGLIAALVMRRVREVHGHAVQEGIVQLAVYAIGVHHTLEAVQDGIQADTLRNGPVGVLPETLQQVVLVEAMEGVHDLVRETHKAIDGMDRAVEPFIQRTDTQRERGAVAVGGVSAGLQAHLVVKVDGVHALMGLRTCSFSMRSATTWPLMMAGGTPGPGTVSWPV